MDCAGSTGMLFAGQSNAVVRRSPAERTTLGGSSRGLSELWRQRASAAPASFYGSHGTAYVPAHGPAMSWKRLVRGQWALRLEDHRQPAATALAADLAPGVPAPATASPAVRSCPCRRYHRHRRRGPPRLPAVTSSGPGVHGVAAARRAEALGDEAAETGNFERADLRRPRMYR